MMTIKAEAIPGMSIDDAFEQSIELAKKLNCRIHFKFNDVTCLAHPKGVVKHGVASYHGAIKSKLQYKIASDETPL